MVSNLEVQSLCGAEPRQIADTLVTLSSIFVSYESGIRGMKYNLARVVQASTFRWPHVTAKCSQNIVTFSYPVESTGPAVKRLSDWQARILSACLEYATKPRTRRRAGARGPTRRPRPRGTSRAGAPAACGLVKTLLPGRSKLKFVELPPTKAPTSFSWLHYSM